MASSKKNLLPRCGGKLSLDEATKGMNSAIENANRLVADAELLFENKRYPSALSIAILAIEEAGKVTIIRHLLTAPDNLLKECWRDYRSHTAKNVHWIILDLVSQGARTLTELREAANKNGEHTVLLDVLKELGFYTDFVGSRNWSCPGEVVEKDLARHILDIAKILSNKKAITLEDNAIWLKHLGPESEHGTSKAGLVNYFREAVDKGLVSSDWETVEEFLYGGVSVDKDS